MTATARLFGWVPPGDRTRRQNDEHERIVSQMPPFFIGGGYREDKGQFFHWRLAQKVNGGQHLRYYHQLSGSCVGCAAGNMVKTLAHNEMAIGEPEQWAPGELWWPWTYGQGRKRGGLNGRGEGSFGSAQAEASIKDGYFSRGEAAAASKAVGEFKDANGWLQTSAATEVEWSDGAAKSSYADLGRKHLVKTAARLKSSSEAKAALQNGYPITIACMFGTRTVRQQGTPPVQLAEWDDRWPHQQHSNGCWDHPTLGLIFYIHNQWGSNAHPPPLNGEPPGGYWVRATTFDVMLTSGEGYAFSGFNGFPARVIDWYV